MKTNYSSLKFVKSLILLVLLTICNISNAETYYMIVTNGNWDANTTWSTSSNGPAVGVGVYPGAGDDVIIDGSVQRNLFINISNAQCASIKNQMTATDGSTFTVSITGTNILTVSGDFDITGSTNYSRTTTLTGTGTLAIGGNINVGTDGITPTVYRTNVMNFNGPNITVAGNLNIYNNVNATNYIASSINHSSGKLTLSGNGTTGYLKTFQNGPGLNGNNFYNMQDGSPIIEFFHTSDSPIFTSQSTNSPNFNAIGATVTYKGTGGTSIVADRTYYNLILQNNLNHLTSGTITIINRLELTNGELETTNFTYMGDGSSILISSGSGVSGSPFIYSGLVDVEYNGNNVSGSGVELLTGTNLTNTNLKSLTIDGTVNFSLPNVALYAREFININDNQLTILEVMSSKNIILNGGVTNNLNLNKGLTATNEISISGKLITQSSSASSNSITSKNITINGDYLSVRVNITATENLIISGNYNNFNPTTTRTLKGGLLTRITGNNNYFTTQFNTTNSITVNGNSNTFTKAISANNTLNIIGNSNSFSGILSASDLISIDGDLNNFTATNQISNSNDLTITGSNNSFNGTISALNVTIDGLNIENEFNNSIISESIEIYGTNIFNSILESITVIVYGDSYFDAISETLTQEIIIQSGNPVFDGIIETPNIQVNALATSIFNETIGGLKTLTVDGETTIEKDLLELINLNIGSTLTNNGTIITENLNVTNNSEIIENINQKNIIVTNLLTVDPTKVLTTGNRLVLASNAINTARVSQLENGAINGEIIVERYIPGGRKWRLLTAPLTGISNNTIFYNWQNNGNNLNQYGTDVWGPNSNYTEASVGLIYINPSTHNFRKYVNGGWLSVTNTKNTSNLLFDEIKNNAFLTFITAPKGSSYNGSVGNDLALATTLSAKGNLLIGTQTYTINNTNYYLIGNPYASPIDFSNIIDENGDNGNTIAPKIWLIDPKLGTFGNYVTWDPVNQYSNPQAQNALNGQNLTVVQSGQAFFVKGKTGATSSNFYIHESNKTSTVLTNVFGRNANTNFERIRVNLEKVGDTIPHRDACVVGFYNGANNNVDDNDVQKFSNPTETLAFLNGSTSLSSEHRAPIAEGDELFLKLTNATISNYKLKIYTENFTFSGSAFLHDLTLGTITNMPLDGSIFEYPFEVTTDPTTQGARFKIVFTTTLSIDDNNIWNISAYPNPTSKNSGINVNLGTLDFGNYTYRVINMLGQEIQKGNLNKFENNQEFKIDFTTAINSGIYSFEVVNNIKTIKTIKLVIK